MICMICCLNPFYNIALETPELSASYLPVKQHFSKIVSPHIVRDPLGEVAGPLVVVEEYLCTGAEMHASESRSQCEVPFGAYNELLQDPPPISRC